MKTTAAAIGLDIGKSVFQAHGVDGRGRVVMRRTLKRAELLNYFAKVKPGTIGMEACATSNHWARSLAALGHKVKLMNGSFVAPFVKSQKNDKADAEAICDAMRQPNMKFVPYKTEAQQSVIMLHRTRELLVHLRTKLVNAFRANLAEFGRVSNAGLLGLKTLLQQFEDRRLPQLPASAMHALKTLAQQIGSVTDAIAQLEEDIKRRHRASRQSRRLATIPGVGPLTASYFAAAVPDPRIFHSGRQLSAWIGLVPRQKSSGGKTILGRITKRGDRYLRTLLFIGARIVLTNYKIGKTPAPKFVATLAARKPTKVAAIAVANKMARIAWAMMIRKEDFDWDRLGSASFA